MPAAACVKLRLTMHGMLTRVTAHLHFASLKARRRALKPLQHHLVVDLEHVKHRDARVPPLRHKEISLHVFQRRAATAQELWVALWQPPKRDLAPRLCVQSERKFTAPKQQGHTLKREKRGMARGRGVG